MYVSICVHSNPYYVASCSPRPSFSATMTDAGTHALLKKWADAVALRTVHRGVYSPDSTRTVSWPSLENCAWSTLDTPVALVKLTHPGVAQPHSLTDPLLLLFDNNPNLQAIVLQLHDSNARAVVEHVKKIFFPLTTTPLFGVEHHRVSIPVDVVDHRHVDDLKELPQWGHAFQSGFISVNWMDKLQDEYGELRADAGLNIFNEDWPAETRAGDSDTRRTMTPPEGGAMYSFAREVLIPHLETHLGWKCPVVNVTTFIVVKAGTVDVEKKQCWHRDINLSYVAGPDQHHVFCLFPMFSPTPDDGCAGDFVVASHTGLPDPWVVAPMAPLDIGDVWLGNALTVHRGGICPTTNPHRPRVFGFISVGTSRFDYNNTCPVVVPPWAGKAAASPEGSQGPHATCGAVGCEVLLDVSDVVEAIWGAAVWSKSSGKVRVFLSTTGEKWSISDSIMVLQSFGGEACPRRALPRPPGRVGLESGETAWGEGAEAGS